MGEDHLLKLKKAVVEGDEVMSENMTLAAIEAGLSADAILDKGLVPGIREIGELFGEGEAYLPELIVSGRAMEAAIVHLEPLLANQESSGKGSFLIGTVQGDLHNIGKNIVAMMMKGNGWKVTDLGVDISPETFCEEVENGDYDLLGLSALLTTTMESLELVIKALTEQGLRSKIKIIVGGAPVTQEFADKISADAFGLDAWDAIVKAEALMEKGAVR